MEAIDGRSHRVLSVPWAGLASAARAWRRRGVVVESAWVNTAKHGARADESSAVFVSSLGQHPGCSESGHPCLVVRSPLCLARLGWCTFRLQHSSASQSRACESGEQKRPRTDQSGSSHGQVPGKDRLTVALYWSGKLTSVRMLPWCHRAMVTLP